MDDDIYGEDQNPLENIKQEELNKKMLDSAYNNSYKLLLKEMTLENIIDSELLLNLTAILTYNPNEGPLLVELENMINYYVDREDYNKCIKLRDLMYDLFPDSRIKK
mgnify:CR=1 FL=1|tara:strand:- start:494 stop:814 length:321 start_codon:yes stop_codon:yes gene_type:complete